MARVNADEPAIVGAINFGSGADTLDVRNGVVVGDIAFGAGADTFNISGGAAVLGAGGGYTAVLILGAGFAIVALGLVLMAMRQGSTPEAEPPCDAHPC